MISEERFNYEVIEVQRILFSKHTNGDICDIISRGEDKKLIEKFKSIALPENIPHIQGKLSLDLNFHARKFFEFTLNFARAGEAKVGDKDTAIESSE